MRIFRDNPNPTEAEVMSYLFDNAPSGETSKGYPGDYVLDKTAKLADLRRKDNTLFHYIAEAGIWRNASNFAESVAYSTVYRD